MPRIAYFDCLSGISGDMTLAALLDLGADIGRVRCGIGSLGLPDCEIAVRPVKKCGFRALQVEITHPEQHAHRHLHHIHEMIDQAAEVSPRAKSSAKRIFQEMAVAEAKVHGSTIEKVHFHEVGAVDSIADIVGSAIALDDLGIDEVVASPVPTGGGSITIAHGRVSVPAPATAELLRDIPVAASTQPFELTTPTGAAILRALAVSFGPVPTMRLRLVGYGAGSRDLEGQANVLRVMVGERQVDPRPGVGLLADEVVVLETNIDDSTPEQLADCVDLLFRRGALDVFQIPCVMKKGRSAVLLSVVTSASRVALLERVIFENTSSIGIRRHAADRHKLRRTAVTLETRFGPVRGKVVELPDGSRRFSAEDDDTRGAAAAAGVTATAVREAAMDAWRHRASDPRSDPDN